MVIEKATIDRHDTLSSIMKDEVGETWASWPTFYILFFLQKTINLMNKNFAIFQSTPSKKYL